MEIDKLKVIIQDMRNNPSKYSQSQKDKVFQGMIAESGRLAQVPQPAPNQVEPGLKPEESVMALKQYVEANRQNQWEKQKEWDDQRQRFGQAFRDMETLGVPKEKLQPYLLKFLEKEAEMNNLSEIIPLEVQKQPRVYREYSI